MLLYSVPSSKPKPQQIEYKPPNNNNKESTASKRRPQMVKTPSPPTPFTVRPSSKPSTLRTATKKPFTVAPKKKLAPFNYVQPGDLTPDGKTAKPFTVPPKRQLAPYNYVSPSNIKPSPFKKDDDDPWPEEEEEEDWPEDMFNPSVFTSHDVKLKEPFDSLPSFYKTRPPAQRPRPSRPNIMNHKRPTATAYVRPHKAAKPNKVRKQQPKSSIGRDSVLDYLDELYSDDGNGDSYGEEVASMFKQVGEDGRHYGAFGNSFVFNDDGDVKNSEVSTPAGKTKAKSNKQKSKVVKGYLKNPFGSDFIKLEVDSERLKHNKTSGVIHVPLVVVDKTPGGGIRMAPPKRRKRKHPLRRPGKTNGKKGKRRPAQVRQLTQQQKQKLMEFAAIQKQKQQQQQQNQQKKQQQQQQKQQPQQQQQQKKQQQQRVKQGPMNRRPGPRRKPGPRPMRLLPQPGAAHMVRDVVGGINSLPGLMQKFISGMRIDGGGGFSGRDLKGD